MYRFVVFQVGDRSGILAVLSHLISDAWTFSLIAGQVDEMYHNLAEGMDYDIWQADYTEYVQTEKDYLISERYKKDKSFWENKYAAQPENSTSREGTGGSPDPEAYPSQSRSDHRRLSLCHLSDRSHPYSNDKR